ncbi:MAG: gamma-glutamyl-gamma-aminobutyrate hydrolase [Pseudonocardiales bacterium]|nr:MAG: gamma-glutamyl-gamma-aminobutyrate hydrolase [Pseudonocardiales bacterium]
MQLPPRIGLTTYREPAAWGVWSETADLLPANYADGVTAAGGVAMLLPPSATGDPDPAAAAALDGLHGLALAGGADVDPARYAAARDANTGPARPDRDAWELTLTRAALERSLPVLAICRGMQVLNVALGGDLVQHLPDAAGHRGHLPEVGVHGRHDVRLVRESRIGALLGDCAVVATYHHQAVDRLGAGLVATGWAGDGTVEALEHTGPTWIVGVQWHPEVHDGSALFAGFVEACARYRADRSMVGAQ